MKFSDEFELIKRVDAQDGGHHFLFIRIWLHHHSHSIHGAGIYVMASEEGGGK